MTSTGRSCLDETGSSARRVRPVKPRNPLRRWPSKLTGRSTMARKKNLARKLSRQKQLRPLAGLFAMGITAPVWAQSQPFPTYQTGPLSGNNYVVGDGQIITPAGLQVDLGIRVRAKAIALNPNHASHTAAVLTLGHSDAVEVFDTLT